MGSFDGLKRLGGDLARAATNWRFLLAFALVLSFGGFYLNKQLVRQEPIMGEKPVAAPEVPPPALDKEPAREPQAEEESVAGQAIEIAARPALTLKGEAGFDDARKAIVEALAKLQAAAGKAGLRAGGRPIAVFSETNDKGVRFEAMLPLEAAPEGQLKLEGGVGVGLTPAGKALKFEHRGDYAEIEATYEAITAFLDEKGLDSKDRFIEEYVTDLRDNADEEGEVDIYVFVK